MDRSLTQCELIPNRIITRNNNYAHRKILINKKFEWLNKYISSTSPNIINPNRFICLSRAHLEPAKNRTSTSSRLKTTQACLHPKDSNVATPRGETALRKTLSTQLCKKENKGSQRSEENCLAKFFRKKEIVQSTKYRTYSLQREQNRRRTQTEECEIRPWKFDENQDEAPFFRTQEHQKIRA